MGLSYRLLQELRNDHDVLRDWLLDYMEKQHEELAFLDGIAENSARNSALKGLQTEAQRHAFFDHFYTQIEDLRKEAAQDEWTEPFDDDRNADLKSVLVWFAIEETVRSLRFELYDNGKRLSL